MHPCATGGLQGTPTPAYCFQGRTDASGPPDLPRYLPSSGLKTQHRQRTAHLHAVTDGYWLAIDARTPSGPVRSPQAPSADGPTGQLLRLRDEHGPLARSDAGSQARAPARDPVGTFCVPIRDHLAFSGLRVMLGAFS